MLNPNWAGPAAAAAASVTWALGVVAYSQLSQNRAPYVVNLTRILIGLPCFLILLIFESGSLRGLGDIFSLPLASYGWLLVGVLCSYAFGDALFFESAKRLGGTSALALASTYPLWAALGGVLFKSERLSAFQILGIILVVAGSILVIFSSVGKKQKDEAHVSSKTQKYGGIILGLLTSLAWATNSFAISRGGAGISSILSNAVRLSMGLCLAPLFGMALNGKKSFHFIPWKTLKPLMFFVFAESFFGPLLYMYGLTRSPLAIGSVLSSLAPVLTVPFAVLLKVEKFSWRKFVGIVGVVLGVWSLLLF